MSVSPCFSNVIHSWSLSAEYRTTSWWRGLCTLLQLLWSDLGWRVQWRFVILIRSCSPPPTPRHAQQLITKSMQNQQQFPLPCATTPTPPRNKLQNHGSHLYHDLYRETYLCTQDWLKLRSWIRPWLANLCSKTAGLNEGTSVAHSCAARSKLHPPRRSVSIVSVCNETVFATLLLTPPKKLQKKVSVCSVIRDRSVSEIAKNTNEHDKRKISQEDLWDMNTNLFTLLL